LRRVFLSYRRDDSSLATAMIYDRLQASFGPEKVFMDRKSLPRGEDFQAWIERELETAEVVVLVVIQDDKKWLRDMRIESDKDLIYLEVKKALELFEAEGTAQRIRVIPVLAGDGAEMPGEDDLPLPLRRLKKLNYRRLSTNRFAEDLGELELDIRREFTTVSSLGGVEFVLMRGGRFMMGAQESDPDAWSWEKPPTQVDVADFWIARTPTTRAQYQRFRVETGYRRPTDWTMPNDYDRDYPFLCDDPSDGTAFCGWLTRKAREAGWRLNAEGIRFTREAEWEFAAAGGAQQRRFPWGNDDPSPIHAVYDAGLTAVGMRPRGATPEAGILDMAGNVFELCSDAPKVVWRHDWPWLDSVTPWPLRVAVLRGSDYRMPAQFLRNTWRVGNMRISRRVAGVLSFRDWSWSALTNWVWTARIGFRCAFQGEPYVGSRESAAEGGTPARRRDGVQTSDSAG